MDKSVFRLWVQRLAGLILFAAVAYGIDHAVRDCRVDLGLYENCAWVYVREEFGLPHSKILRWLTLQGMGVGLLGGVWVGVRLLGLKLKA